MCACLEKMSSSQCRGLTLCVYLFSPPKHKNMLMRQNSLIWTQHIIPCKKLLSQYTAPSEKRKNWLLAIVTPVRSYMHLLEGAKQNRMDSEI